MNSTRTGLCTVIDEGRGIGWVVSLFLSLFVRSVSFLSDDACPRWKSIIAAVVEC